jgi:hypothetical protein
MATCDENIGPYTYQNIGNDQFRVIKVQSYNPEIRISLEEHSDSSPPEYFALSYAWGTENPTEYILCENKLLPLTPHLKEGLRSIFHTCGTSNLWIDAICIDQNSKKEKEVQVAKMHGIYQKAKAVYVWLGAADANSDGAITAINQISLSEYSRHKPLAQALLRHKTEAPQLFPEDLFQPMLALSRRTWYRRLWIAQEYIFAKSVKFICGKNVSDGAQFLGVLLKLTTYSFGSPPGLDQEEDLFGGFLTLRELDKVKKKLGQSHDPIFFDFLVLNRERAGKEPVDRIYAAFGMATGKDEVYRSGIPIDYSEEAKSKYWKLYATFGKIALQHEPNLRLLSIVSSKKRPENLPTWCPNLNSPEVTSEMDPVRVYAAGWPFRDHINIIKGSCTGHPHFNGEEENHIRTYPKSDVVSIWGASLGCIKAIGYPCEWKANINLDNFDNIQLFAKNFLQWFFKNERFCTEYAEDEQSGLKVHDQLLVSATNEERRPKGNDSRNLDDELWGIPKDSQNNTDGEVVKKESDVVEKSTTGKGISHPNDLKSTESLDPEPSTAVSTEGDKAEKTYDRDTATLFMLSTLTQIFDATKGDYQAQPKLAEHFEMAYTWIMFLFESWNHRVPFVTNTGRFGFASEDIQMYDQICMFYSGRTLYVLRAKDKVSNFVSDAYVLGCVNGEVFEMLDEDIVKEERFDLV